MYELTITDNVCNRLIPCLANKRAALNRRTLSIQINGYASKGFTRSNYTDDNGDQMIRFDHAVYSTVIYRIHKVKS